VPTRAVYAWYVVQNPVGVSARSDRAPCSGGPLAAHGDEVRGSLIWVLPYDDVEPAARAMLIAGLDRR